MFANCGDGHTRKLEDCAKLNFISAGQGKEDGRKEYHFSNQIRNLILGDILCVYRNGIGFVGIAKVISIPMPITEAELGGKKVKNEIFSSSSQMFRNSDQPGYEECMVEVDWITDVHLSTQMGSGIAYGMHKIRPVTCSLKRKPDLKRKLEEEFQIEFDALLKNDLQTSLEDEDEELSFPEGKEKYSIHKSKERNKALVDKVKMDAMKKDPKLRCCICHFSFFERYGERGNGFIEAHHIFPISKLTEETETKIKDLILVCSNCHRMLHRNPWLSKNELQDLINPEPIVSNPI